MKGKIINTQAMIKEKRTIHTKETQKYHMQWFSQYYEYVRKPGWNGIF